MTATGSTPQGAAVLYGKTLSFARLRTQSRDHAFRHRNASGDVLPGAPRKEPCGTWHVTRTRSYDGVPTDGSPWDACHPGTRSLLIEGRTFRPVCSQFPVADASRPGCRPFGEGRLTLSQGPAHRSRRRNVGVTRRWASPPRLPPVMRQQDHLGRLLRGYDQIGTGLQQCDSQRREENPVDRRLPLSHSAHISSPGISTGRHRRPGNEPLLEWGRSGCTFVSRASWRCPDRGG
jgi:hypothetical protein